MLESSSAIDYVVRGEGEATFYQLVLALEAGNLYPEILGLSFRNKDGSICVNDDGPLIENLDLLPFPIRYNASYIAKADRSVSVFTSRGCYGRCSFCALRSFLPTWRARSAVSICDEIEHLLSDHGARRFYFVDENFLGRCKAGYKRGMAFAEEVLKHKLDINFTFMCRVDDIEEMLFVKLKAAGLRQVNVGVESFATSSLKLYNKQIDKEAILRACSILRSLGIRANFGWIMFHPIVTPQ